MQVGRRHAFRLGLVSAFSLGLQGLTGSGARAAADDNPATADDILQRLIDGNQRYAAGSPSRPNQSVQRRLDVAPHQHPYAVVLTCADSRVTPELIFDTGIGDLFVARVAGNIAADPLAGSIEYAVEHFNTKLVMVLGHQRCGAVSATMDAVLSGDDVEGPLGSIVDAIRPAVALAQNEQGDLLDNAIRANIDVAVDRLRSLEPLLADAVRQGELTVVGAYYSLDTGVVELTNLG